MDEAQMRRAMRGAFPTEESKWRTLLCFTFLIVGLYLCATPIIRFSDWEVSPDNHAWMEAMAWSAGRLDIGEGGPSADAPRPRDTVWRDGKLYNPFPPLFTFICYAAHQLTLLQAKWGGLPAAEVSRFYSPWYVAIVAMPLPLVGFWAIRRSMGRSDWAAVLTAYWLLGTPLFDLLYYCKNTNITTINHVLSNTALMLIVGDVLGRRRIWPASIGFVLAVWTRPLCALYLPAIAWAAWRSGDGRRTRIAIVAAAVLVGPGTSCALNKARFGSFFDSGYGRMYDGRDDQFAQRYRETGRLFDIRYLPRNFEVMSFALPEVRVSRMRPVITSDPDGVSIWLTSPLLLFGFVFVRRWWGDPARRAMMLCSFGVMAMLLMYHTTGSLQRGIYRFALDFIPVWLAVIAPWVSDARHRRIMLVCLAWSVLYFHLLCATEMAA